MIPQHERLVEAIGQVMIVGAGAFIRANVSAPVRLLIADELTERLRDRLKEQTAAMVGAVLSNMREMGDATTPEAKQALAAITADEVHLYAIAAARLALADVGIIVK
jgi:hypothetical protein